MQKHFTVFVCESQPVVLEGLRSVLHSRTDLVMVGSASDLNQTKQQLTSKPADMLLIGQPPGARSALPVLVETREASLSQQIVLWVGEISEMDSFRALQMGARGIVSRTQPIETLIECLRTVGQGSVWIDGPINRPQTQDARRNAWVRLTPRERQIVEFVCRGMKNKEIAEALSITAGTVKVHLMHIFEKAGVKDRFQLALQGRQLLIVQPAEAEPSSRVAEA